MNATLWWFIVLAAVVGALAMYANRNEDETFDTRKVRPYNDDDIYG